uniref:RNase H type-1 domain-containing protein n=1 Tax=Oryza brachyantha TaxID=4533 RepID=J3MC20_ORYBR
VQLCKDALEAECFALLEGIRHAIEWTMLPLIIVTDCANVIQMFKSKDTNRSQLAFVVMETKRILTRDR